jgi:ubiquinone/menaquinone biosynthesis C-methylase UbiE
MKVNMDFWQDVLDGQPESFKKWFSRERYFLQENIKKDSKVLEVGCGAGRSISDISSVTQNIVGIDHDEKAIDEAKENFKQYPSIKLLVANATELPFDNECFDFVICMTTFVNFAHKKYAALEEMKRVLKKNGKIIISVYSEKALSDRMQNYKKIGLKIKSVRQGTVIFDENFKDNVSEQFSETELRNIFSKVDLRIEKLEKVEVAYLIVLSK